MPERLELALVAVYTGAVVGILLFVPFVAISYRRRGGLTLGRFGLWAGLLVYFIAIWTYTLLPLPQSAYACAPPQLDPTGIIREMAEGMSAGGIASPQIAQLLLNVLLFLPLGFFGRMLFGRGALVTLCVGFALSLAIELTQLTGVWGLYACPYRVFDVGDLMTNTVGALIGSWLTLLVPVRYRSRPSVGPTVAAAPRPVTRVRKLLAMVCDGLGSTLTAIVAVLVVQLGAQFFSAREMPVVDTAVATSIGNAVAVVVWAIVTLVSGRTVGDLAVELEYRGRLGVAGRMLRFLGGIGGFLALTALPGPWSALAWGFALLSVVIVLTPIGPRGLPGLVSGRRLDDARTSTASAVVRV